MGGRLPGFRWEQMGGGSREAGGLAEWNLHLLPLKVLLDCAYLTLPYLTLPYSNRLHPYLLTYWEIALLLVARQSRPPSPYREAPKAYFSTLRFSLELLPSFAALSLYLGLHLHTCPNLPSHLGHTPPKTLSPSFSFTHFSINPLSVLFSPPPPSSSLAVYSHRPHSCFKAWPLQLGPTPSYILYLWATSFPSFIIIGRFWDRGQLTAATSIVTAEYPIRAHSTHRKHQLSVRCDFFSLHPRKFALLPDRATWLHQEKHLTFRQADRELVKMYNAHRGMVQPPSSSNNRLSELFDQIRREFDTHAQDRAGEHDQNSEFVCF